MHVLLIEGHEPVVADQPARLLEYAAQQVAAMADPLDETQQRSLRALGAAVTSSGKVVRIEPVTMLID